jgi:hypothetical protein
MLFFAAVIGSSSSTSSNSDSVISVVAETQPTQVLDAIQRFGSWWAQPDQPLDVRSVLPTARPHQPWPYRAVASASHASITTTESYAMQTTVVHAPLKGEGTPYRQ